MFPNRRRSESVSPTKKKRLTLKEIRERQKREEESRSEGSSSSSSSSLLKSTHSRQKREEEERQSGGSSSSSSSLLTSARPRKPQSQPRQQSPRRERPQKRLRTGGHGGLPPPTKAEVTEKKKKRKTKFKSRKHEDPNQSLVGTMRSLNDIVGNPKAKSSVTKFMKDALPGSVMVLHGPTGIGKSVLVQTAAKLNRVFLHTLRSMEKDNTSIVKRLKEYMLTPKTFLKECFFIDPFEEISADATTTRSFCELLTSDRGQKSGRCFVIVVNDQWHKAYYPLRTGKMAKLAKNVAMYKLSNAEIRGIINRNNVNGYNSRVISCGVKAADGDGRKAVTFAKDRVLGEGIADRKIDVFKAASAVFAKDVETAMTCPERDRLHDFVRTNLSQFMPHYMVHSKPDQLKLLEQYSDYYDSLSRFDVEGFSPDVPLHFAAAASAGKAYKKMEMPVETFKKRMRMREIRRMDCHIFSSVDANTVMRIISSEDSFWCSECNRGLTEGTTFFCPKAKVAMDDYRRKMSERLEGTGVSAKALADALLRFDMRKFMDDVGVRGFQYK